MKCSRRQIIRRRSVSFLGVAAKRHLFAIPTRRRSVSSLGVAAKRHLFAIPTRRRSVSSVWSFTITFWVSPQSDTYLQFRPGGGRFRQFGVLRSLFGCRRRATPICNSDQAAVGFGFKCRREATGKSAADEGNEPFRHPSKSFCALDVE